MTHDPSQTTVIEHDAAARNEPFPLTPVQAAYWLGRQPSFTLGGVGAHFYAEIDVDPFSESDEMIDGLEVAWQRLVDRHDMLRMVVTGDGNQRVLTDVPPYHFARRDFSQLPSDQAERAALAIRDELSHQVFDPSQWPLFELRFSRLPQQRARLHFSIDLLIADFSSLQVLVGEWLGLVADPGQKLPELELGFRDYVVAEAAQRGSHNAERSRMFWMKRLAELPLAPQIPTAINPEDIAQPRFIRREATVSAGDYQRLIARGRELGVTPSIIMMAIFAEVLSVWTKRPEFTLNATFFNRQPLDPRLARVIGDFTSLTLVPVRQPDSRAFAERAAALQRELMQALDHSQFSALQIMRELARQHGISQAGMMPVVFTSMLLREQVQRAAMPAWSYAVSQTPQVWLDHQILERDGGLYISWDSLEDLFPPGVLDEMFDAFRVLLAWTADERTSWRSSSPALTPRAHLDRVATLNATDAELPDGRLEDAFWTQVEQHPARTAVVARGEALTYGELAVHVRRITAQLRARTVQPNELVGLVMERGWEQIAGAVAVLTSGAAYLPLDPDLPLERLRHLLVDGGVRVTLTQSAVDSRMTWPDDLDVIRVDAPGPSPERVEAAAGEQNDLAYVIYTSGSTGLPKGVMIDHLGAVNTVHDIDTRFAVGPKDRVLALSAMSFDLSVWDLFGLLGAGGAVVLPDPSGVRDPAHWAQLIAEHGVTVWNSVPALLELAVDHAERAGGEFLRSLRLVLLSGDWIPVALPDRLRAFAPDVEIVSLGGATEASIWSIHYPIGKVNPEWKSIPYGRALKNQRVYVLDSLLRVRPVWAEGEIYISGVGLAQGYWNDDEQTRRRFIIHPRTGERLYRTGDLGRYLPDGNIEFLGREDLQVKVHGYRVELAEIESALQTCPIVATGVVRAFGERDKRLVAYVVAPPDERTSDEVRTFLLERLPAYMVPPSIEIVDALPLTPNGKVDRGALPEPASLVGGAEGELASERERVLSDIWKDVLGLDRLGRDDRFFDVGGDSLVALRVISRAAERGLMLRAEAFIVNPSLARLAQLASEAGATAPQEMVSGLVELTPSQRWFLEQEFEEPHHWNGMWPMFAVATPFNQQLLRDAFAAVLLHHDGLRQRYHRDPDGWTATIAGASALAAEVGIVDMAHVSDKDLPAALERAIVELNGSLDLAAGPLVRLTHFDLGSGRGARLLVSSHWLVLDNYSARVFLDDLRTAYVQLAAGESIALPPKTASLPQCLGRLRDYAVSDELAAELPRWRRLQGARTVPLDFPDGANTEASLRRCQAFLNREETEQLRERIQMLGVEIKDVLLAALLRAVTDWTGERSIVVEFEGHGRESVFDGLDISRTVGRLSTLAPLLLERGEDLNPAEEALSVAQTIKTVPHSGLGYGVLRYLHPDTEVREQLEFPSSARIGFNFWGDMTSYVTPEMYPASEGFGSHRGKGCHRARPLDVMAAQVHGVLVVNWQYSANLHAESTIEALAQRFLGELHSVASTMLVAPERGP